MLPLDEARNRLGVLDRLYATLLDELTRRATGGIYDRSAQWQRNVENRGRGRGKRRGQKKLPPVSAEVRAQVEVELFKVAAKRGDNSAVKRFLAFEAERSRLRAALEEIDFAHLAGELLPLEHVAELYADAQVARIIRARHGDGMSQQLALWPAA